MRVLLCLLGLSCTDGGDDLLVGDVKSIRVTPAEVSDRVAEGASVEIDFEAWATLTSGEEVSIDLVSWSLSNLSTGDIDSNGRFESVDTNGGVTEVTANHLGIEGSAVITLVYAEDRLEPGTPDDAADAFAAVEPSLSEEVELLYPFDGATVPRNIEGLAFAWATPSDHDLFRIRLESELSDISIYTASPTWVSDAELWAIVASTNKGGEVEVHVESGRYSDGALSDARRSESRTMTVNRMDARGSVLYWSTAEEAIMRIPLGETEAQIFYEDPEGRCTGCHSVSDQENRMVVTFQDESFSFGIMDISDPTDPIVEFQPVPLDTMIFSVISPDGRYIAGVYENPLEEDKGTLMLYSALDRSFITELPTDYPVTHPSWAPDGESLLMVHILGRQANAQDFHEGEVVEYPFADESIGEPRVIVPFESGFSQFAPVYSPDGDWIAYLHCEGSNYANQDSTLWLSSADGTKQILLENANAGAVGLQNSFPRWAPLPDDDVLWLAFSSRRSYPPMPSEDQQPQIWVSAIDTDLAAEGQDPSKSAFWLPGQDLNADNHWPVWWSE